MIDPHGNASNTGAFSRTNYASDGSVIAMPNSFCILQCVSTAPFGTNNSGDIVGFYENLYDPSHGYEVGFLATPIAGTSNVTDVPEPSSRWILLVAVVLISRPISVCHQPASFT